MALEYYTEITWLTNAHHTQGVVAEGSVDINQPVSPVSGRSYFYLILRRADSGRRHIMWLIAPTWEIRAYLQGVQWTLTSLFPQFQSVATFTWYYVGQIQGVDTSCG